MMKKLFPILTAILLAFGSNGQAPAPYPILVDSQRDTVAGLQVFQANQITFRASYRSGNATNNLVAVTPFMYWQPYGPTNATVVTGRWTIVSAPSGTVDFAFTPADLNFATGTYTYQVGLNVSGGPNVIKQGSFIIKASQASIGASPIAFATTNVNWGAINWSGLPAYEYQTNTIAISNALNGQIVSASNSLSVQISSVSNALNTAIVNTSNALNTRVTATETGKVAKAGDTMSGNLGFTNAGLTSLDFATFHTAPTGAISQARMQWQSGRQTMRLGLNANVNLDVGQQVLLYARNEETNTLSKGEVVFVAGANGDNPTIKRASNSSEALSARTIGITAEDITVNASGHVVTKGTVYGLNTTNFTQGANLYLGANGTVQTNLPDAPLHGVFVGVVERVHQNVGQIYVAIQNYQELRELSDVFVNGVANNDLIVYNAASSRWQNVTLASLGITTGGGITVESDPIFVAASNSFYPRSNPSNFVTTATLSGYATGTPLYVEADPTALTNVTASGRITATPSGKQVALTFDASGLATGTPIYSVAGLATGTPLYVETDPIFASASNNFYLRSNPSNYVTLSDANEIYLLKNGEQTITNTSTNRIVLSPTTTIGPFNVGPTLQLGTPQVTTILAQSTNASGSLAVLYGTTRRQIWDAENDGTASGLDADLLDGQSSAYYLNGANITNGSQLALILTNNFISKSGDVIDGELVFTNNTAGRGMIFHSNQAGIPKRLEIEAGGSGIPFLISGKGTGLRLGDESAIMSFSSNGVTIEGGFNLFMSDLLGTTTLSLSATNGLKVGTASFNADVSGNISQDSTNTAALGIVTATSFSGNHIGNAASLTNFPSLLATTTSLAAATSDIATLQTYTSRAASALSSSVWASADSTTNYASRVTFGSFTSSYATADATTNYASRITFNATSNSFNSRISNVATGAVYITNLAAIAGSGLGVVSNKLITTNVSESSFTNWLATNTYIKASIAEHSTAVTPTFSGVGNRQIASYNNAAGGTISIQNTANGADQAVRIRQLSSTRQQSATISGFASVQRGWIEGNSSTSTVSGIGSIGLFYLTTSGQLQDLSGNGSIAVGPVNQTNNNSIYASGLILSDSGFVGNAANLTNFPSSLLTVSQGNTNYWRITTAPTNATESGQRGQMAVSSSNVFIYSPDALGTGTGRWIRISGSINWP